MHIIVNTITQFATIFGFICGLFLGTIIGWIARGLYKKNKEKPGSHADTIAVITSIAVISLWALAHINNIFFGGGEVNWVLNVIGGLAVSSLIQERDGFVKIISAIRGGGKK